MRRAVTILALAALALAAPAHAEEMPARGRVASLYVQHGGSDHLLIQVGVAPRGAKADRADLVVARADGAAVRVTARVPAQLPLAAGDEVEFAADHEPAIGVRGTATEYKITRLIQPRMQSAAAPGGPTVAAEGGRLFLRGGEGPRGATVLAHGAGHDRVAELLRSGPAPLKLSLGVPAAAD